MPDEKTKQAMLEALEAGDYDRLIELAEKQPTLREPDTRHAPDGGGASDNQGGL